MRQIFYPSWIAYMLLEMFSPVFMEQGEFVLRFDSKRG